MTIGIIAAMQMELENLKQAMEQAGTETISGMEFIRGTIAGKTIVAVVCGIGKVYAAICAQTMILRYAPDAVINIGVAGTLVDELGVLDIAIADSVCQHDMDTSALGDPVGLISGADRIFFPAEPLLVQALSEAAEKCGFHFLTGHIASGDQFIHEPERKRWINNTFSACAVEMEGGSIGQVCYTNNVPFAVLRCISDGDGGKMDYQEFAPKAAAQSVRVVLEFLEHEVNL